ncbi:Nn.00g071570.m01.CDS01 [Neocucurbitaria sp. VM-36]
MSPTHYVPSISRSFRIVCKKGGHLGTITSLRSRALHQTTKPSKDSSPLPPSPAPNPSQQPDNPSNPSFNLFQQIREARPAVRYTVYAGVGLMATVESTFWFSVIKAKFFPSTSEEDKQKADEFLDRIGSAVKGYRKVWMRNYGRYYGAHLWGVGYGGLDGLEDEQ